MHDFSFIYKRGLRMRRLCSIEFHSSKNNIKKRFYTVFLEYNLFWCFQIVCNCICKTLKLPEFVRKHILSFDNFASTEITIAEPSNKQLTSSSHTRHHRHTQQRNAGTASSTGIRLQRNINLTPLEKFLKRKYKYIDRYRQIR
jgi:hypothetical protein